MAGVHKELDRTRDMLAEALAGCSEEQLVRHPEDDPARWSARQVVEHLYASWRATIAGIDAREEKGRPLLTRPTWKQRALQQAMFRLGYFPRGRQAPEAVLPGRYLAAQRTANEMIARLSTTLAVLDRALNRIEAEYGRKPVLTHPILGPLNVHRWRNFHRVHARHHLGQIRRALGSS